MRQTRLAALIILLGVGQAHAGIFDDDEARRRIIDAQRQTEAQFAQQSRSLLDLSARLQQQSDEIAHLRGMLETAQYELDLTRKRQQDFYLDLDTRVRKLESAAAQVPAQAPAAGGVADTQPAGPTADPQRESADYEAALARFKAGKYKEATWSFSAFVKQYPSSALAPNAQYWLGNAWYAQQDCKKAIDAQLVVTQRYADSPKAADAWWIIATCYQETGAKAEERSALEALLTKYPTASQAADAKRRLAELQRASAVPTKVTKKPGR